MSTTHTLFSIDVDAHLRKAAAYTFGSRAHYPVELIRAALRRGAREIDISITKDYVRMVDDGEGLSEAFLDILNCMLNPKRSVEEKEAAVEFVQSREAMGLLAIFASNPHEIEIETVSAHISGRVQLVFKQGKFSSHVTFGRMPSGSTITLVRGGSNYLEELRMVEIFCRSVPRQIRLNGKSMGNRPLLSNQMAAMRINAGAIHGLECFEDTGGNSSEYIGGGHIGIPLNGSACRIRFLDMAIPWHHVTLPPQKGFVFDAAVEYTGNLTQGLIDLLCEYAAQLYTCLCGQYDAAQPEYRHRIEELVMTHYRATRDEIFFKYFSPFEVFHYGNLDALRVGEGFCVKPGDRINLEQVKKISDGGALYAVPRKKKRVGYHTGIKTVLALPREQADLLINQMGIPMTFLNPVSRYRNPLPLIWRKIKGAVSRGWFRLLSIGAVAIHGQELNREEQRFWLLLTRQMSGYRVEMVDSVWPFMAVSLRVKDKKGVQNGGESRSLLPRKDPLVRKAVKSVQQDSRNIEVFAGLLKTRDL